jgi:hypothetical protein
VHDSRQMSAPKERLDLSIEPIAVYDIFELLSHVAT